MSEATTPLIAEGLVGSAEVTQRRVLEHLKTNFSKIKILKNILLQFLSSVAAMQSNLLVLKTSLLLRLLHISFKMSVRPVDEREKAPNF